MQDQEMQNLINREVQRQSQVVNLIASENYVSQDVLYALGSKLTNKYAEGYPHSRYYGGNNVVDEIEELCQKRALDLFGLNHEEWRVNVQPLSGSPANVAVYLALVPLGEKIMGMSLDQGGHLTHGHKVSITGKIWKQVPFGVSRETELIDYDELGGIARENNPKIIVAGFTAYPRQVNFEKFREIADSVGTLLMVDMSHVAGLVAGGVYPSPFTCADIVTTTTHKTLRGPRGAMIFSRVDDRNLPSQIDKAVFPGIQGGPHINQIAATAVALLEASSDDFKRYARQIIINAQTLAHELVRLGWRIISGGTDTHLILLDTWMGGSGISGGEASNRLEREGIIVNKNTIPYETRSPMDPSGVRLGTAAITTQGAVQEDMLDLAKRIDGILRQS